MRRGRPPGHRGPSRRRFLRRRLRGSRRRLPVIITRRMRKSVVKCPEADALPEERRCSEEPGQVSAFQERNACRPGTGCLDAPVPGEFQVRGESRIRSEIHPKLELGGGKRQSLHVDEWRSRRINRRPVLQVPTGRDDHPSLDDHNDGEIATVDEPPLRGVLHRAHCRVIHEIGEDSPARVPEARRLLEEIHRSVPQQDRLLGIVRIRRSHHEGHMKATFVVLRCSARSPSE